MRQRVPTRGVALMLTTMSTPPCLSVRRRNHAPHPARMMRRALGPLLLLLAYSLFAVACTTRQADGPRRPAPAPAAAATPALRPAGLYSAEEALTDALSGQL